jgi:type II secretory pathway pseudopilin PulG
MNGISPSFRKPLTNYGMTLAEVVIAISILAFSIPLILAATGAAHRSRQATEADTRSAWLIRDVQRNIINGWSQKSQNENFVVSLNFPEVGAPKANVELVYKQDGTLILDHDVKNAVYLVTIEAEPYSQNTDYNKTAPLALISVRIQYPAKAGASKQTKLSYQFVTTREGMP